MLHRKCSLYSELASPVSLPEGAQPGDNSPFNTRVQVDCFQLGFGRVRVASRITWTEPSSVKVVGIQVAFLGSVRNKGFERSRLIDPKMNWFRADVDKYRAVSLCTCVML